MNHHFVQGNNPQSGNKSLSEASLTPSAEEEVRIPISECEISFTHSGGPGGQNVNKVATCAVLKWYPELSDQLSPRQLEKIVRACRPRAQESDSEVSEDAVLSDNEFKELSPAMKRLRGRMSKEMAIVLQDSTTRDQLRNKHNAVEKLEKLVNDALKEQPRRKRKKRSKSTLRKERKSREKRSRKKNERRKNKNPDY